MNIYDILLIAGILAWLTAAIVSHFRRKAKGCSGCCSSCNGCSKYKQQAK